MGQEIQEERIGDLCFSLNDVAFGGDSSPTFWEKTISPILWVRGFKKKGFLDS
jgi:hypothetical protein